MDEADMKKVYNALAPAVNLETQLSNFLNRAARAGKAWGTRAKDKDARWSPAQVADFRPRWQR
jgi:hypothetical protein